MSRYAAGCYSLPAMITLDPKIRSRYEELGFVVVEAVVEDGEVALLRTEVERLAPPAVARGGVRDGWTRSELFRQLARTELAALAERVLGPGVRPVKLTVFDKTPEANWKVPMHQDLTIAVAERKDAPGFGPWTVKAGVPHVQPPAKVLDDIVAVRLHLDACPVEGGALRVLPGSHRHGRLESSRVQEIRRRQPEVVCPVGAGGVMLMSPLLLHASSAAQAPRHRRVLHYEFSRNPLPAGLQWAI